MFNTELGLFCHTHDNWEELLTQEPYNLKISEDGPYVMFKYNQLTSDFTDPMVQEARGIIFRKGQWENPVCWAFNKFFNCGEEAAADIDWSTAFVTEKIDGSLIKFFYDEGKWHIATNGTIDAFKAELGGIRMPNFGTYVLRCGVNKDFAALNKDLTYMFEIVGPYNRVVIPYEETELYFLGARNKYTGEQYTCDAATMVKLGVSQYRRPKVYSLRSINSCIDAAAALNWDEEGFVVCDAQFNRVKIKSPAYVMAHYARNNNVINRKHLIQVILSGETEEFLCYAEDYREELEKVQNLMKAFCKVGDLIAKSCQRLYDVSRGTYANWVKTLPKIYQDLAFRNYNNIKSTKDYTAGWNENKWETYLESFEQLREELFNG